MRVNLNSPLIRLSVDLTPEQVVILANEAIDMAADVTDEEADDGVIVEEITPTEPESPPLMGSPGREKAEPVAAEEVVTVTKPQKHSGFLHLKCNHCGEIKTFCAKVPIDRYRCGCGQLTSLGELRKVGFLCECGKWYKYQTNMEDEIITMNCFSCGSPVDLEWNRKNQEYTKMK